MCVCVCVCEGLGKRGGETGRKEDEGGGEETEGVFSICSFGRT